MSTKRKTEKVPAMKNQPPAVVLRTMTASLPLTPEGQEALPKLAMKWSRMVANRERWDGTERDRQSVEAAAVKDLEQLLGQPAAKLGEAFGIQPQLEVSIRWGRDESESWAARIMPWEYLIPTATRSVRKGARLIVVRHLDCSRPLRRGAAAPDTQRNAAANGLVLCSTPAVIGAGLQKSLIEEARVVGSLWKKQGREVKTLRGSEKKAIEEALKKGAGWIHFLGVNGRDVTNRNHDSIVLGGRSTDDIEEMSADEIHQLIAGAEQKPSMAVFNFCSTAGRLAASAVAGGAGAAIGFQDLVSDQICMDVVGAFYPALKRRGGDLLAAFVDLWNGMEASLGGTVIVLWSARSLIGPPSAARALTAAGASAGPAEQESPDELKIEYGIPDPLEVRLEVASAVNFSLLHNGRSLFHHLEIGKADDPPMKDVLIEVTVNDGGQSSSWRTLRTFKRSGVCIAKDVQLSFISSMVRSLRESLVTSLQIAITCGGRLRYSESVRIRLLSIDEWVDDDDNRCWLPSFVHPRDPAVAEIITRAEGYLQALCDDFGAGFDGYQADPDMVALQVRALWVAISRDCLIRYINPPPTYTKASQRLRRPGEMLATRQGTCLDLALLLSACLEWIGVYPVIFLISGHAFPGYWRSEEDYRAFYDPKKETETSTPVPALEQRQTSGDPGLLRRWITGKEAAASVLREVQSGRLAPLETVWLTKGRSFADALRAGRHNLYTPGAFEFLIDVQRAREHGITPLPLPDKL